MSMPVTISVTVCSTWMRGLTSMKYHSPRVDIHQELDGAGVVVAGGAGESDGGFAKLAADAVVEADGGRDLDHFLMAALHRAVALVEVEDVAVAVAQDLDLDWRGAADVALDEDRVVAEGGAGLAPGLLELARKILGAFRPRACRGRRRRKRL